MPVLDGWIGHAFDIVIVGGGAAGLAAARTLMARRPDLALVVLEANDRIGGRAWTASGLYPVDLGCGWLHGATTNAWTGIAGDFGFAVDKVAPPWSGGSGSRRYGLSADDTHAVSQSVEAFFDRLNAQDDEAPDRAMSEFLEPHNRWNSVIEATGTYINGAELEKVSTVDYGRYEPGPPPDWRVRDGYGRLIATFGAAVPVVFDAQVERILHGTSPHVAVETNCGTLRCRALIVTIATSLLATEQIRFDPPLPEKGTAAATLPLGLANKLFLTLGRAETYPLETHLLGSPDRVGTAGYHMRPFGRPMIEAYFGGALAHDIERAGPAAAVGFAIEELSQQFGTAIRSDVSLLARSAWAGERWARGSYSYAMPGHADARAVLAAPVEGRLFFAGEACSRHRFSTAHGAYETGVAAAAQAAASLASAGTS